MLKLLSLPIAILLVTGICSANETVTNQITAVYAFSPHKLSAEEQKDISLELDAFWDKVESSQDLYLPALREALSRDNHSPFFYYDASKLLLHLSNSNEDKQIALNAFTKTDLRGVNSTDYLRTVTSLSIEGFDTASAALHILTLPDFKAFIPQHSLTLGQNYSRRENKSS